MNPQPSSATNDYSPLSRNRESSKQVNVHSHVRSHARSRSRRFEAGPIVFGFHTLMAWKRKVDTTKTYFQLRKTSSKMSLLFQSMKFFVCWVLTSHGNQGAALYEFSIYEWFREWCSTISRYRFAAEPGTFAKPIAKKTRVQLADLLKVRCEESLFSAPRQLMRVVEGREVIVT